MRNWRVLTAVIAVIFGVGAAAGSYYYLNKADERAQGKQKLVQVLVAKKSIPAGTLGQDATNAELLGLENRVAADVPPSAVYTKAQVATLVAVGTIDQGSIITSSDFVLKSAVAGGLTSQIQKKKGLQAMTLSVDLQHGVAGLVSPGDSINMIVSVDVKDLNNPNKEAGKAKITAFLLSNLKVLAIDKSTVVPGATPKAVPAAGGDATGATTPTTAAPTTQNLGLLTVEVSSRQAEQIAHAYAFAHPIYLTLNPTGFDPKDLKAVDEIVEIYNYFDQDLKLLRKWQALVPHTNN